MMTVETAAEDFVDFFFYDFPDDYYYYYYYYVGHY